MRLDGRAVHSGVVAALTVALPAAVVGRLLAGDEGNEVNLAVLVTTLVVFVGLLFGGFAAGMRRPDAPLTHGAVATLIAYVLVQAVGIALIVARGDDLAPTAYVFNAFLAAGLGVLGGLLANVRSRRTVRGS